MERKRDENRRDENRRVAERVDENAGQLGAGGGGSNDITSGAGNASGTPDAETAAHAGDAVNRGSTKQDREKLFPQRRDPKQSR